MVHFKKTVRPEAKKDAKQFILKFGIKDPAGIHLVETFADAYTLELNSMDIVQRDGLSYRDRFNQIKSHPLCSVIRDARAQKMAALKALNLDLEPLNQGPGRPPGR
jgi:phage terminase small subunit